MTDQVKVTAEFERDNEGNWLAHLVEEPRAHTYGRTFVKAVRNIRQVAAMWFDADEDQVDVRLKVDGTSVDTLATEAARARTAAMEAARRAVEATRQAVQCLAGLGLAERDVAELIGLSHQRVHQLVVPGDRPGARAGKARRAGQGRRARATSGAMPAPAVTAAAKKAAAVKKAPAKKALGRPKKAVPS